MLGAKIFYNPFLIVLKESYKGVKIKKSAKNALNQLGENQERKVKTIWHFTEREKLITFSF